MLKLIKRFKLIIQFTYICLELMGKIFFVYYSQIKMDFFSVAHAQIFRNTLHCFHCRCHRRYENIRQALFLQSLLSKVYLARRFSFRSNFLLLPVPDYSKTLMCLKQRCKLVWTKTKKLGKLPMLLCKLIVRK